MNLWDLKPNEIGTILSIEATGSSADRLYSLGFEPGQDAQYLYKTALNGPRVFRLNETIYSLSSAVASQVIIQLKSDFEKKNP